PQWRLRREARLVLPECAADEGSHAEGLRRDLLVGRESARPKIRRSDHAGDDAMAVARRSRVDQSERHGRAGIPATGGEKELGSDMTRNSKAAIAAAAFMGTILSLVAQHV